MPLEELRGRVGPVPGWEMLSRMPETMAVPIVPLSVRIGEEEGSPSEYTESIVFVCHCMKRSLRIGIGLMYFFVRMQRKTFSPYGREFKP